MKQFLRYILTLVAIFIATTPAWAGNAKINANSDPSEGGFVYVANSAGSYTPIKNSDDATQEGDFWSKKDKTFYLYYKESANYHFKGWYQVSKGKGCDANSTNLTNQGQSVTHKADGGVTTANYYYYAIFATVQCSQQPSFATIAMGNSTTGTLSIKHAHANSITIEITGENASDFKINNTTSYSFNSTALGTQNITITFKPTCAGDRKANLKITNGNGLPELNIAIQASATLLPQTIAWDNAYSQDMFVGGTLNVSATASTGHTVTYESSNPNVISITGNTLTAKAIGEAIITATQHDGCTYQTVSTSLTFTVNNKKTPTFWLNGNPDQLTDNLKTEDTRTITITNVDERMTADYDPNLLSYTFNGSTATIKALDAGTATLKLTQPENNQIFYGERTFTFNITKYDTNTITNDLATNYMVDDVIAEENIYTINNNEVPVEIISGNNNILKFENGQLKAEGAGTTTLTVKQSATNKWVERTDTKTITVHKYDITATINPDNAVWNQLVTPNPFSASTQHKFSGATSAVTDFTVNQQGNEHIALMDANTRNIQTYFNDGTVKFLVSRQEDYKYNALSQTLTLHVNQSTENCPVLEDNNERSWGTVNNSGIYTIPSGTPDSLFFQARRTDIAGFTNNDYFYAEYSTDNNTWNEATKINLPDRGTWYDLKCDIPKTAKYVRFVTYTGATGNRHIRNVRITRAKELTPSESPVILNVTSIGTPETKTFTLKWSTCADEILLTNSNPHFTINTHNISSTAGQGSTAITVTCDASIVGTLRDTIVIYDQTQRIFVPVECIVNNKFIANIKGTTAYSKKVDDTWVTDFKFDTCQTTLPSDDINAPFYYTIDHNLTGNDVLKPDYEDQVITYVPTYNPDTKEVVNTITAHNAGTAVLTFIQKPTQTHYTDTFRCVITVTKYTTSFDLKGRTTYYTGDEDPYNALFNTLTNNSDVTMTFTSGDESVIKYEDSKLKALCAGSTSFTVAQAESYKWFGLSQTLNINVSKYDSQFALTNNGADIICLIGDQIDTKSLYTTTNNEIPPTIISNNPEVVSFNPTTRQLEANTAGEAIITIAQPVDCKWTEYTATRKIIVQKHTPVFTFQKPVYFNDTIVDYFTTSNTQTALTIASQTDTDVAIAYFDQNNPNDLHTTNLISFNKEDTTIITFTQEENWYWYARTYIDTIVPIDPNNHVTFTLTENNHTVFDKGSYILRGWENQSIQFGDNGGGLNYEDKYLIIEFTGIPDSLSFTTTTDWTATTEIGNNIFFYTQEGKTKDNLSQIWSSTNKENNVKIKLNPDTRWLKICYSGNLKGFFHNVTVTELNQFEAIPDTLNFGQLHVDEPSLTKTFDFKYANAGYKVQFESTDTMFTIATTYIDSIGGEKHGTINGIEVTYHPTHIHNTNTTGAKILIWDEAGHRDTVHLVANTIKSKPSLYWTEDWSAHEPIVLLGQHMPDTVAKATNGYPVKYRSDDESILKIAPDSLSFIAVGIGETYITAHADSDRVYLQPDTIRKLFRVTDKLMQYILWEDNLTDFCIGDQPDTLHAQAWVMTDAATGEWEYSPEQTAKIQYYSSNPDVVEVQGNLLIIKGEGELLLSATINGDTTYEKTSAQVPVRVRDCSVTCSDADLIIPVINSDDVIMKPEDKLEYDPYALWGNTEKIVRIDTTAGIPGHLIFAYYGRKAWGTLEGKIRVFESTDGGSNWQQILSDADAVKPLNQQTQYSPYIPLSRNATHIKFERFDDVKLGYHILQYITITPAQYIESIPDDIALGNIYVGNTVDTTVAITYSSIRSNLHLASSYPSHLTIDKTTIEDECGAWDTIPLIITLEADISVVGPFNQYVTVSDPISGITDTIHITANIVKNTPTITWNTTDTIRSSAEWETKKTAISSSGDQVLYEITQGNQLDEFAYLNDTGKMILLRGGWITARAYTAETTTSNEVSNYHNFFIIVDPLFEDFSNDGNWLNDNNWNIGRTPWATDSATIKANKHVLLTTEIVTEGLRFEAGSSIHITPTGGLSVGARGIQGAATDGSSIIIDNLKTGIGFLRISPAYQGAMPRTTVNYQTRSTLDTGANRDATWQYFGAPGKNVSFTIDYITWLYQWNEKQNWVKQNGTLTFEPFAGYAITQYGQPTYSLVAEPIRTNQTITLTKTPEDSGGMNGDNLFANSFMAPIDVKNFTPDDFSDYGTEREDIVKTFYIFNSGSWNQWNGQNEKDSTLGNNGSTTPGQYCAIPALSAQYLDSEYDITTIPPMQGVYVIANKDGATIRLDYNKHIWQAGTYTGSSTDMHEPMRAPQRQAQEQMQQDDFRRLRLQVNSANSGADRMYIIQESTTTRDYDNGYDAPNQFAEGIANIYTTEPFGKMEVSCANDIDSMYIGFQAGTDEQYTLSFRSLIGDSLYLKDLSNDSIFLLTEGGKYHFTAQPLSTNDLRFQVLLHPVFNNEDTNAGVTTDMEYVADTHIWHDHNQLYITNAPANSTLALYNINGQLILSHTTQHTTHTIDLYNLHQGVYILQLNNQMYKFVRQ